MPSTKRKLSQSQMNKRRCPYPQQSNSLPESNSQKPKDSDGHSTHNGPTAGTNPMESLSSINKALTTQITQSVTQAVMVNLRQAGILAENSEQSTDLTSEEQNKDNAETTSTSLETIQTSQGAKMGGTMICISPLGGSRTDGYVSSHVPLHALISQNKKEKIWAGEYINLSTLQEEDVEDITFNIRTGAVASSVAPKKKYLNNDNGQMLSICLHQFVD